MNELRTQADPGRPMPPAGACRCRACCERPPATCQPHPCPAHASQVLAGTPVHLTEVPEVTGKVHSIPLPLALVAHLCRKGGGGARWWLGVARADQDRMAMADYSITCRTAVQGEQLGKRSRPQQCPPARFVRPPWTGRGGGGRPGVCERSPDEAGSAERWGGGPGQGEGLARAGQRGGQRAGRGGGQGWRRSRPAGMRPAVGGSTAHHGLHSRPCMTSQAAPLSRERSGAGAAAAPNTSRPFCPPTLDGPRRRRQGQGCASDHPMRPGSAERWGEGPGLGEGLARAGQRGGQRAGQGGARGWLRGPPAGLRQAAGAAAEKG